MHRHRLCRACDRGSEFLGPISSNCSFLRALKLLFHQLDDALTENYQFSAKTNARPQTRFLSCSRSLRRCLMPIDGNALFVECSHVGEVWKPALLLRGVFDA